MSTFQLVNFEDMTLLTVNRVQHVRPIPAQKVGALVEYYPKHVPREERPRRGYISFGAPHNLCEQIDNCGVSMKCILFFMPEYQLLKGLEKGKGKGFRHGSRLITLVLGYHHLVSEKLGELVEDKW